MPDHYPDTKESLGKTTTVKGAKIKGASKLMGGSPVLGPASTSLFSGGGRSPVGANAPIILGNQKSIAINSRKISILKNISESHGKRISGDTVGQKISGGGLLESLNNINDNVNGIVDVLVEEQEFKSDSAEDERKRLEALTRGKKEKDLEKDKFAGLKKVGEKVLAPVKSLWEKLWGFLQTLILGRFAIKLWDWLSDKKNQKKVAAIGRFLKDWWPVLLSSYVIFGTGFIKMAAGLVRSVGWAATKMVTVIIPALVKAIAKLKSAKLIKGLGGLLGGLGGKGKALTGLMGAGAFAEGGVVPGSGSGDTVPAMLTPGEFVMSKGAVQQYGADTLAGMNAAAGGTNRPTRGGYKSGGMVNNMSKNSVQYVRGGSRDTINSQNVGGPRIHYNGGGIVDMNRFGGDKSILPRIPVQYFKGGGEVGGLPTELGGGGGGTDSLTEQAKTKTVGTWIGDGIQELFGITPKRMRDTNTGMDDSAAKIIKSSPSQIVINPPPTVSPEVVSQNPLEEVNTRLSAQGAPSQDLPEFSASKMRSGSKIKTLGIVV